MQTCFTWEADMFHCSLCMQLFATDNATNPGCMPVIICKNIHTVCRACALRLQTTHNGDPPCPQCRTSIWKQETVNRDRIEFMDRLNLQCGSCDNQQLMDNAAAVHHARECTGTHIQCPMFMHDSSLTTCMRNVKVSEVWEHCQHHHNDNKEIQSAPAVYTTRDHASGAANATGIVSLSFPFTLQNNTTLYATATTAQRAYSFCVHVLRRRVADGTESVALCVRRFFPAVLLVPEPTLVSIEVGTYGGLVLHLTEMISCHDKIEDILSASPEQTIRNVIQIPLTALRQMHDAPHLAATIEEFEITISIQLFLREHTAEPRATAHACI